MGSPRPAERGTSSAVAALALALHVLDPAYGLTSILDFAPDRLPADFQDTISDLDPARLLDPAQHLTASSPGVARASTTPERGGRT